MNAYAANDAPLFGEQQQAGPVVGDLDAHSAMIMHDQLGVLGAGSSSAQWHARSHSHSKAGRRDEHDHRYADTDDDDDDEDDLEPPAFLEDDSRAQGPYRHELVNDDKHHHQQHRASSSLLSRSRSAESLSSLMRPHEAGASTTTLFLYPHHDAQPGGATARAPTGGRRGAMVAELDERVNKTYRDPGWIVIYGMTVLVVLLLSLYISLAAPSSRATSTPALMPALLAIPIVSLLALACSVCALAYVLVVHNAVRHLIALVLLGAPLTLVSVGLVAFYVSFLGPTTTTTTTTTQGSTVAGTVVWRVAMRVLALGACLTGVHMLRGAAARHARAERTARVLSLATGIVLAHPALLVYALALAASSLVLTLPFVSLLAALAPAVSRAEQRAHPLTPLARLCAVALLCAAYLWTLAILRAVQRAAAAGTAGEWWYAREQSRRARHRLDNNNKPRRRRSRPPPPPSIAAVDQVVASAFRRATGPSLGTVIGAAFFVALIQGLALLAARARRALVARSSAWSTHGLAARVTANVLTPALALLAGTVELYSAWAVGFAGITGDNLWDAATRTREIVRRGRAERVMENLIIHVVLRLLALMIALVSALLAFVIVSSRVPSTDLATAPLFAAVCFAVPYWSVRLCAAVFGDVADAAYLCYLIDKQSGQTHCVAGHAAFEFAARGAGDYDDAWGGDDLGREHDAAATDDDEEGALTDDDDEGDLLGDSDGVGIASEHFRSRTAMAAPFASGAVSDQDDQDDLLGGLPL